MYRAARPRSPHAHRFPHTRGDVPPWERNPKSISKFSPHAWGCTRHPPPLYLPCQCFPHTRGDVPQVAPFNRQVFKFSPHAWGCTVVHQEFRLFEAVFPTRVGMYRLISRHQASCPKFSPHAWGCTDKPSQTPCRRQAFSPHAWGCTVARMLMFSCLLVFPTRVGMYRWALRYPRRSSSVFPTRVGMYRVGNLEILTAAEFSPHAWGCTASEWRNLQRHWGFPHTRGDVPWSQAILDETDVFSPHAWGCTGGYPVKWQEVGVFPTRVGMYRPYSCLQTCEIGFPHTRGDVPGNPMTETTPIIVFPTRVGMYRSTPRQPPGPGSFSPHAWGCTDREFTDIVP